jgi:hypothetical protein
VTLSVDLPQGHFQLAAAGRLCGDWVDTGNDTPAGRGLLLVCLAAPVTVCDLRVTWLAPGAVETASLPRPGTDWVGLANGDRIEGDIVAIAADTWTIRRTGSRTPAHLPATAIRTAFFRAPEQPPAHPTGSEVRLTNGSLLNATVVDLRGGCLCLHSESWGELALPLAVVSAIRFAGPR